MQNLSKYLVVDANSIQRNQIAAAIMQDDIAVYNADNICEAMELIINESISGVILGIGTNELDCLSLATQLASSNKNQEVPIYFLTDKEPARFGPLTKASSISQHFISRASDLNKLKVAVLLAQKKYAEHGQSLETEQILGEVVEILESYTEEIHDSIRYASYIQKALLPSETALDRIFRDYFVINKPKDVVSGDFFWYTIKYNRIIIAVADCTGHGVPGALLSMIGNNLLNSIVNEKNITNPALILKQMNQNLQSMFENAGEANTLNDGMDMAIISIDSNRREIEFSGARRPIIGYVNGELVKIKGDVHTLGCSSPISAEFKLHKIPFGVNDTFYLGSDGYCDQFGGESDKKFGTRHFIETLTEIQFMKQSEQKVVLNSLFEDWKKNVVQTDDVLVMGLRPASLF